MVPSSWLSFLLVLLRFLFAFELSVLDVDTIFIDVSLLMVRPQLFLGVTFQENVFIAWRHCDIIVEFFDLFISELFKKVDDESSGNLVYHNP